MLGGLAISVSLRDVFRHIEDKDAFIEFVGEYFRTAPADLAPALSCAIEVDPKLLSYAHAEYVQDIRRFSEILQSGDPDHYKRAGALLHALYVGKPITGIIFEPEIEAVDTLCTPIGTLYADSENSLTFGHFFNDFPNEFMAFSLAYDLCCYYERDPRDVDFDYLQTVCTYLNNNRTLSVESLFMIFKSIMR